jgi:enoyl-CoA hydratase/carnithine racemase
MRGGLDRLRDLPIPTAALIEGACYGAGVALAMACDLRLASAGARFGITPAKLGIGYPQEDVHRLVGLVGAGQAGRLLFSAGTIDAAEAHRIGLVELIAEPEGAAAMLASIAAMEPGSLRMLKRGIGLAAAGIVSDEEQDRRFDELLASDELAARLAGRRRG